MNFYTVILRKSQEYWVSFCLENGLVGQGNTQQQAIDKLQEAIASFEEIYQSESNVHLSALLETRAKALRGKEGQGLCCI